MPETKKVLLVEDDPAISDVYTIMLKKANLEVQVMALGQDVINLIQAVQKGEAQLPDIVVLDLILPDINGLQVLKTIRTTEATKDMKVFISTNQEATLLPQIDELKPTKYIIKANTTPTQLVELIKAELF